MKRRVDASLRDPRARERNVKLGRGGIREVEFGVQAQQLVHGGKDARLRERSTLGALARARRRRLRRAPDQAEALADGLPLPARRRAQAPDRPRSGRRSSSRATRTSCALLVRRLGLLGADGEAEFWRQHAAHTGVVDAAFAALFHGAEEERRRDERPELATLIESLDHEELAMWQLGQLGFSDLDGGVPRPAAAARRAAVRAGAAAPAPGAGRARAGAARRDRELGGAGSRAASHGDASSPRSAPARAISTCCSRIPASAACWSGSSPPASSCPTSSCATPSCSTAWCAPISSGSRGRATTSRASWRRASAPQRTSSRSSTPCGASATRSSSASACTTSRASCDPPERVGAALGAGRRVSRAGARPRLARRARAASGCRREPPTEGSRWSRMGKLGGAELNYHSDLDLIFVYDAGDAGWWRERIAPHEFFTRVAQRTISMLQTPTREGVAYRIDTRLRPSGNQGPLVSSLEAFEAYHRTGAQLWERQALIKARPVEGPAALRARLERDDHPFRLRPRPRPCRASPRSRACASASRRSADDGRRAARQHQDRPRRAGRRRVRRADAPARATDIASRGSACGRRGRRWSRSRRAGSSPRRTREPLARGIRLPARAREPAAHRARPAGRGARHRPRGAARRGAPAGLHGFRRRGGGGAARGPRAPPRRHPRSVRSDVLRRPGHPVSAVGGECKRRDDHVIALVPPGALVACDQPSIAPDVDRPGHRRERRVDAPVQVSPMSARSDFATHSKA